MHTLSQVWSVGYRRDIKGMSGAVRKDENCKRSQAPTLRVFRALPGSVCGICRLSPNNNVYSADGIIDHKLGYSLHRTDQEVARVAAGPKGLIY